MAQNQWDKVGELFEEAREVPPDERAAFLEEACEEESVRKEVLSLLEAEERAGKFFEDLAQAVPSGLGEEEPKGAGLRTDDPLDLEGATVGRYRIETHLGGGGMGVVYKARDPDLDRTVALKFLPPHLASSEEADRRFVREAKAAAALGHSNIATVHDIGETEEGRRFIAMAYYEGETLKEKIGREGPLPVEEVLGYAEQIAEALGRAHEAGIIHRDVKPANVIVTGEGEVKLLDFGLAKAAAETRLTDPGQQMGTAAYMSPEQAEGKEVDGRTDLWALGALLYEMLAGERPFEGGRSSAVIHAILQEEPTRLGERRGDVPAGLEQIVHRCLQKDPEERYASADALLEDLRAPQTEATGASVPRKSSQSTPTVQRLLYLRSMRDLLASIWQFFSELRRRNVYQVGITYLVVGFAVIEAADLTFVRLGLPPWTATLVVVLVGLGFPIALVLAWALEVTPEGVRRTPSEGEAVSGEGRAEGRTVREGSPVGPREPEETEPGIAVLPFEDMSPEGDQQYFGDGLAEELLDALASIEGLRVAARTSSYAFRDDPAPVQQIGEQLGVSHLLEGSVRKAGDRLRVTAQLVDASDGYHAWSDTYDRTASDIFEIQDEITQSVVGTLEGILLASDEGSGSEQAARVEAGTDDPEAHDLYLKGQYYWNHRSRFGLESAIECFDEAIDIDPEFARPYAGLAVASTLVAVYRLNPPDMLRGSTREAIDRALELEPELAEAWHAEGLYRAFFDAEWEAAVSALRRAAELDPNSGRHAVWAGFLGLHLPAPPDDVHVQLSRAEQLEPRSYYVIAALGLAAVLDRRYDDAVEFGDRALEIEPEAFISWFVKGVGHLHRSNGEAGLEALERGSELAHRTPFPLSLLGSAAAQAGHPERTRSILRELEARSDEEFVAPLHTAMLKAALGRVDDAVEDLEQERAEYGAGSFTHLLLHIWPALEEDRRYREMLEEVGLRLPRA